MRAHAVKSGGRHGQLAADPASACIAIMAEERGILYHLELVSAEHRPRWLVEAGAALPAVRMHAAAGGTAEVLSDADAIKDA